MKNKEEITLRQETCIYDRHAILFEEYILLFQSVTETFTSKQLTTNQHGNWFLYSLNRHCFDQVWSHNFYQSRWGESLFKQDTFYIVAGSTFKVSIETVELISDLRQGDVEISGNEQRICPSASEVKTLRADNSKAGQLLNLPTNYLEIKGFQARLKRTIDWFCNRENLKLYKSDLYND